MRCCRPLLEEALEKCHPQAVIALGSAAFEAFYPGGKVTEYHGAKIRGDGYLLFPMFKPDAQDENPDYLRVLARDYSGMKARPVLEPIQGDYKLSRKWFTVSNERFAIDTETTGLELDSKLKGISFSDEPGRAMYIPARHARQGVTFEDKCVMQNAKYDLGILQSNGVALIDSWASVDDTMLLAYVMEKKPLGLKTLAVQELNLEMTHFKDVAEGDSLEGVTDEDTVDYACADADATLRLWTHLWRHATTRERNLYEKMEKPLPPILAKMELAGVNIDIPYLHKLGGEIDEELEQIEVHLEYEFGLDPHSLGKPKKMQDFIYGTLKLPVSALDKDPENPSCSRRILERIREQHSAVDLVLRHNELAALKNNFVTGLLEKTRDGKAHPKFNQARVKTGRMSSSNPNFQGLPSRRTSDFRRAIVAPEGYVVAAFDNSQIDLRSLAHVSQCPVMNGIFERGEDIHAATSMLIYGDVEGTHRFEAKAANFMPVYGGTYVGLARRTGLPEDRAQEFLDKWYAKYWGVTAWLEKLRAQALKDGFVDTIYGRRLHVPELFTRTQAHALRICQNMPIQGTSADVMKLQMIAVAPIALPFVQIHDELAFYLRKGKGLKAHVRELKHAMETVECPFRLVVDAKVGPTLGDLEKVEEKA
jgi:DNA polymerase-1